MAKKIRKINFSRLATDEVFGMQCRLAWQWTLENVSYDEVKETLLGEDTVIIPDSKYSQKDVVPICEFKGAPYDVDGSEPIWKLRKKVDDLYGGTKGFLGKASMLDDKDDAYSFIDKLEVVQNLYQLVKDKKPLPVEDPFGKDKKSQQATQQGSTATTSAATQGQVTRQQSTQQAASDDEGWFTQFVQNTEQEEAFDPQVALANAFFGMRPNFAFLAQFKEREDLALALDDLGPEGREELFKDFKSEYDAVHAAMDAFDDAYAKYVKYIATAIVSFNKKDSVAYQYSSQAEAAQKAKNQQQNGNGNSNNNQQGGNNRNDSQNQGAGNNNNQSQFQNKNQEQYVKRQKDRLEKKILAAVKDNDGWSLQMYRSMQEYLDAGNMEVFETFRATEKKLIEADKNGEDTMLLCSMIEALVKGDFEEFGNLKEQYDLGTGAGDDQQNGYSNNHSNNNTGDTGSGQGQQDDEESQRILKQLEDLDAEAMDSGDIQRGAFIGRGLTAAMRGDLEFAKAVIWLDAEIQRAESEDGDDSNLELLGQMRTALYKWDTDLYNKLLAQYKRAKSKKLGDSKMYTKASIVAWLAMQGVAEEDYPDLLKMTAKDSTEFPASWVNEKLEALGIEDRLEE